MREFNADDFFKDIDQKKPEVNKLANQRFRSNNRKVRMRPRNQDEQKCLDIICREKWLQAVKEGKVRYITEREMDYFVN